MRVDQAVNIEDLHRMAKRRLPKVAFDFIEGGLEDERGLARNEAAFHKHRLLPRYLVDVSKRDQSATVFGRTYSSPFGISPTGGVGLYRREGEVMLAEAAAAAGLRVDFVSRIHNGVALAEELSAEAQKKRVFLPRSDRANPELLEVLNLHGWQVTPVVAYKTVSPNPDSPEAHEILRAGADAILFFSPSAVHHLRDLVGAQRFRELSRQSIFVAIGPVSENALKAEGISRILPAADTTVAAAIATMTEYFAKAGQQQPAGAKQG